MTDLSEDTSPTGTYALVGCVAILLLSALPVGCGFLLGSTFQARAIQSEALEVGAAQYDPMDGKLKFLPCSKKMEKGLDREVTNY